LEQIAPFDDESATAYGIALTRTGDLQQAISVLQKLTAASPSNYQAVNALGMAFYKEKDYARAAAAFKSAIEIAPEKGELRYNLAIAQLALRNRAGALGQYKLLQESSPSMADRLSRILFRDKLIFVGNH
jgi:Flp pilus assembly protein TadD